jgi:hypothetical protein
VPAGSLFSFLQSAGAGGEAAGMLSAMCATHYQYVGMFAGAADYATSAARWSNTGLGLDLFSAVLMGCVRGCERI